MSISERIEIVVTDKGTKIVRKNIELIGKSSTKSAKGVDRLKGALNRVGKSRVGKVVRKNIQDVGIEARKSATGVNLLRGALGGLGAVFAIRGLVNLVDTYANLQNRLRLVTDGTADLARTTEALFGIATRTRTSFEGTADAYAKIIPVTKNLGLTQKDTLQFTESLNQAIVLSGVSAQNAEAGLRQFIQGFGKGKLDGDELKSTVENIAGVADVLAKKLGVTRVELSALGESGVITSQLMVEAFADMREELGVKFASTIPTISQAMTNFGTAMLKYIGQADQAAGSSAFLAEIILTLSENLDIVIPVVLALATAIGINLALTAFGGLATAIGSVIPLLTRVTTAIAATTRGVIALTAAMARNPLGLALIILTSVAAAFLTASGEWGVAIDIIIVALNVLKDAFFAVFGAIIDFLKGVVTTISALFGTVKADVSNLTDTTIKEAAVSTKAAKTAAAQARKALISQRLAEKRAAAAKRAAAQAAAAAGMGNNFTQRNNFTQSANNNRSRNDGGSFATFPGQSSFRRDTIRGTNAPNGLSNLGQSGNNSSQFPGQTGNSFPGSAFTRLPGLASGGAFRIAGLSGTDKNVLSINNEPAFRVNRGETVEVRTANQQRERSTSNVSGGGGNSSQSRVTNIFHIQTPDAASFEESRGQIEAKMFASQQRADTRNN